MYRQRARTVAKIFRGAKPADIPVEQSARFQLIINLKAARSIGHEVPAGELSQQHGSYLLQHLMDTPAPAARFRVRRAASGAGRPRSPQPRAYYTIP
jgi:ABC transporter substrate binding protein